jgi:hypothetical protein
MPLNGNLITVGQVEQFRPASPNVPDTVANPSVIPFTVRIQAGGAVTANMDIGDDHATIVAGLIISTDATDDSVPTNNEAPLGVAPNARLRSSAYLTGGTNYVDPLLTTQYLASLFSLTSLSRVRAINHSWSKPLETGAVLDGNSLLTLGMDWMSRHYDVLQIVAGNEDPGVVVVPTDDFNGLTVAYTQKANGTYSRVGIFNDFDPDASGPRTSTDLVAPGDDLELASFNGAETMDLPATSWAAPHVTGVAALLHQYADFRIAEGAFTPWLQGGAKQRGRESITKIPVPLCLPTSLSAPFAPLREIFSANLLRVLRLFAATSPPIRDISAIRGLSDLHLPSR